MPRRRLAAGLAAIAVAASVLFGASPAMAQPPVLSFESTSPLTVAFGAEWVITLKVAAVYDGSPNQYPLGPTDGTVDVFLSGIGGPFAKALPIQTGGVIYVSQSLSQPLVPAGDYQVSAIFNPAPGTYLDTAQTPTPLTLTVTPLEVKPAVTVGIDPRVSAYPVITASISGSYAEANGGAPAGTWHFDVTKEGASTTTYTVDLAQAPGESEPLRVEVKKKLDKGAHYTVSSTFTPVDETAGGVTVGEVSPVGFDTPAGTFGEALSAPAALPLGGYLAILILLLGLIASTIVFGLRLRGRSPLPVVKQAAPGEQRIPGDPSNVELVSLEDLGLPEPATIPELYPEGQETTKLPTSTTWLLSDVEPATGLPSASEAPTERIDAVQAADLMTERISTTDVPTERIDTGNTDLDEDADKG